MHFLVLKVQRGLQQHLIKTMYRYIRTGPHSRQLQYAPGMDTLCMPIHGVDRGILTTRIDLRPSATWSHWYQTAMLDGTDPHKAAHHWEGCLPSKYHSGGTARGPAVYSTHFSGSTGPAISIDSCAWSLSHRVVQG